MADEEKRRQNRRSTYRMMIVVALAISAGRIAVVTSPEGDTAFLSANDRSRWCAVASLVEHGTYAIDHQIAITDAKHRHRHPWGTIDKVQHLGNDGQQHFYSSKPPLLPTLVAGVYRCVHAVSGMTLTDQPIYMARIVLALVNLPLLALFLVGTIQSLERIGRSDWGRRIGACGCCFGTMLLPFSVSLNNHLPAAAATAVAMWIYVRVADVLPDGSEGSSGGVSFWGSLAAGLSAGFAAANELPALSMMMLWFVLFILLDRSSLFPFLIGVAVVALGFFGTNWIAHQSFRPPYAHRGNGDLIASLSSSADQPDPSLAPEVQRTLRNRGLIAEGISIEFRPSDEAGRWVAEAGERRFGLLKIADGWQVTHWDDWYEYPGTYWKDGVRRGVDRGEPSRLVYVLQMTIGHHGIFSLTPIWLLVPVGLIGGLRFGSPSFRRFAFSTLLATTVCLLFYVNRPLVDRNYGGVSVCFRWMLWFAPLWLLVMGPVMDWFAAHGRRRAILLAMLALSVFSMSTALTTPWQAPWLYRFWQFLGWINV